MTTLELAQTPEQAINALFAHAQTVKILTRWPQQWYSNVAGKIDLLGFGRLRDAAVLTRNLPEATLWTQIYHLDDVLELIEARLPVLSDRGRRSPTLVGKVHAALRPYLSSDAFVDDVTSALQGFQQRVAVDLNVAGGRLIACHAIILTANIYTALAPLVARCNNCPRELAVALQHLENAHVRLQGVLEAVVTRSRSSGGGMQALKLDATDLYDLRLMGKHLIAANAELVGDAQHLASLYHLTRLAEEQGRHIKDARQNRSAPPASIYQWPPGEQYGIDIALLQQHDLDTDEFDELAKLEREHDAVARYVLLAGLAARPVQRRARMLVINGETIEIPTAVAAHVGVELQSILTSNVHAELDQLIWSYKLARNHDDAQHQLDRFRGGLVSVRSHYLDQSASSAVPSPTFVAAWDAVSDDEADTKLRRNLHQAKVICVALQQEIDAIGNPLAMAYRTAAREAAPFNGNEGRFKSAHGFDSIVTPEFRSKYADEIALIRRALSNCGPTFHLVPPEHA